jgi:hypothetical protein
MALRRTLVIGAALVVAGASALRAQETLRAVWGSGPADIWAAGNARAALHFDGRAWTEVPYGVAIQGDIAALWGSGPTDVFAAGEGGAILHWDGRAWSRMAAPTERQIVALGGRSAREVYALAQSYSDREAPTVLRYDGRAWTVTPLPLPFRANAMALSATSLLVAGFAMNDPTPGERRTVGVLARRLGLRWVMSGWNGRAVTDPVLAGTSWNAVDAVGATVLLTGERDDGSRVLAISRGGAFTFLPAVPTTSGSQVSSAFLASDGVPVAFLSGAGLARYIGRAWGVSGLDALAAGQNAQLMRAAQQMQQMAQQDRIDPQMTQQLQQVYQNASVQNQLASALQFAAWGDLGNARAAWGSSTDFYAVTENGRIIRVQAAEARIVYDASCANPQMAAMNPICQGLQPQGPRPPLPMPSVRTKPRP